MKKWILFFAAFALAVVVCFLSYLYLYRAEFAADALSKLYGTPVKLAKIRVTQRDIELQNVIVYNPTEYAMQPALTIEKVVLKMSLLDVASAFFGFTTNIRKIHVIDPVVAIEMTNSSGAENNWKKLLSNMATHIDSTTSSRFFNVQTIEIRDIAIEIRNKEVHKHTKRPPAIHQIVLSADKKLIPQTIDSLLYWTTKLTLTQIGQQSEQPNFAFSILHSPSPKTPECPF